MSIHSKVLEEIKKIESGIYGRNYASHHEFYAVLKEEVEEIWEEIKKKKPDKKQIKKECIQVIAVCTRYLNQINEINQ